MHPQRDWLGRHRSGRLAELDQMSLNVSLTDRSVKRMRRSARISMIGSWAFGVLSFLGVVGVVAPRTPENFSVAIVILVFSITLSAALGIRSHRKRRSSDEMIRRLIEGDGQPNESPADGAPRSAEMTALDSATRELSLLLPELARVLPDVALLARSAEVTLARLGRRVLALEIELRSQPAELATQSTTRRADLLRADHERTSQSLNAGLDAYQRFVHTAAVVVADLPSSGTAPVDELHRASEELENLAFGLAEVSKINRPYLGTGA